MLAKDKLTEPERRVLQAAGSGALVDLQTGDPGADCPALGGTWDFARTVRAELLVELLTGARKPPQGPSRALKLRGARIVGELDLESAVLICPLALEDCHFDERIDLTSAEAPSMSLRGCQVPSIAANFLHTHGSLNLGTGFEVQKGVQLAGARIDGELYLSGAKITNTNGRALIADWLSVGLGMVCRDGFSAVGQVSLNSAHIGGRLFFSGARLTNPGDVALAADQLTVDQSIHFDGGFSAAGTVWLVGAQIGGRLDFSGAHLADADGHALVAQQLSVGQDALFTDGFTATGGVVLTGAQFGGTQLRRSEYHQRGGPGAECRICQRRAGAVVHRVVGEG